MLKYYGYITEQYFLEKNVKGEIMKKYDYLIVGAGLFGAVFAHEMTKEGKKCLVIDKRDHIAGNIYCENVEGINVHKYGAHIFHTSDKKVWEYINQFAEFNNYINSPVARYKDELYNLPFNMNTFSKMFGIKTPAEAKAKIQEEIEELGAGALRNAVVDGDVDNGSVMAGQIAGLVSKEETCAEILEDIYYGAAKVIQREAARWADVNV